MRCQSCHAGDTKVVDSRPADDGTAIRRRRLCPDCDHRFTTYERLEEQTVVVSKRSGGDQPFDREKVIHGVSLALKGRPVPDGAIADLATRVEDQARLQGARISSDKIGQLVLSELRLLDSVAALRFASVYKHFDDVTDFEREALILMGDVPPGSN